MVDILEMIWQMQGMRLLEFIEIRYQWEAIIY